MMRKDELQEWIVELKELTVEALETDKEKKRLKCLTQIAVVIGEIRKYPKYTTKTDCILDMLPKQQKLVYDDFVNAISVLILEMNEDLEKLEEFEDAVDAFKEGYEEIKGTVAYAVDEAAEKAKAVAGKAKDGAKCIERKARTALRNWIMKED